VFITDSESWEVVGSAGGSGGTFAASSQGGARPQTAEIIKTFGERCPGVMVNNKQAKADYVVVLDHEGGKGYLRRRNKVAVFNKDGDSIVSRSTRSLGNSVQDACGAIVADWSAHLAAGPSQSQGTLLPPSHKESGTVEPSVAETPAQMHSASTGIATGAATNAATLDISSIPPSADIEIDGVFSGNTPSSVGVAAGEHTVRISKKGFAPWERRIRSSSGNVRIIAELETSLSPATSPVASKPDSPAYEPQVTTAAPQVKPPASSAPVAVAAPVPVTAPVRSTAIKVSEPVAGSDAGPKQTSTGAAAASSPVAEGEGTASVTSNPDGAEIFVDSVGRGRAPAFLKLKAGKHKIQLAAEGYKDWVGEIEMKNGSIVNITGTLEK
jgi:PEGA domain